MPLLLGVNSVLGMQKAQVKLHLREFRHNIGHSAAIDHTGVDGDPLAPAVQALELQRLVRYFNDGIASFLWLNTGMGRTATGSEGITGVALTRTDDIAVGPCRL